MEAESSQVGPYRVLRRLGAGGMAETYVAERGGPGGFSQQVCLKCIRPDRLHDPECVRQFLSEARILAGLRHTTIVQVLDFGEQGSKYYLALELVRGCDLSALLSSRGRLTPDLCLQVAVDLATALDVAHRGGVVHRDVSPSNVLLSLEGEVKLTDFGIAKTESTGPHTQAGIIKGKVPYMAPEYAQTGKYESRNDLFSLGVLLFECLTAKRPYDGATDIDTMTRASLGKHEPLRVLAPGTPVALGNIVSSLLRPLPDERPPTAGALRDQLLDLAIHPRARRHLADAVNQAVANDAAGEIDQQSGAREQSPGGGAAVTALAAVLPLTAPADRTLTLERALPPAPSEYNRGQTRDADDAWYRRLRTRRWLPSATFVAACVLGLIGLSLLQEPAAPVVTRDVAAVTDPPAKPTQAEASRVGSAQPGVPDSPDVTQVIGVEDPLPNHAPAKHRQNATWARATAPTRPPGPPAAEQRPQQASPGTLTVVVIPYGNVTIDGKAYGEAPIRAQLPAGKHRVLAEAPTRDVTRTVTLRPGQRKRLVLQ